MEKDDENNQKRSEKEKIDQMVKFLDAVEKDVEFYEVVNWRMRLKEIQERR